MKTRRPMTGDGTKRSSISALPPPKLHVENFAEARASELETLHSIVANRLNNDFRSRRNKRRRTTAYDNQAANKRNRRRRKLGAVVDKSNATGSEQGQVRVLPRRVRRRIELRKNPSSGFSTSGDGTKRLRTHVWHAKRFTMTKLWGFHLPVGLHGRGRGSRALLKWYKNGALVHDASYYTAIQLEGPQDSLMAILRMVLEPSPSAEPQETSSLILNGAIYGSAMLHHVGVPGSQLIAPVTYMWQPSHGNDKNSDGCDEPQTSESCSSHRQLWVWIHASAFHEGYVALKFACQKQMNESGSLINCFSLEGQLAKLELMGSKAFQLLQKILLPVSCDSNNSWQLNNSAIEEVDGDFEFRPSILEDENIYSCSVLSFTVRDPRAVPEIKMADVLVTAPTTVNYASEDERKKEVAMPVPGSSEKIKELMSPLCSNTKGDTCFFYQRNLWDASSRVSPPVEESVLCFEKHHSRMDFLYLECSKSGDLSASTQVHGSRSCPVLLLKDNKSMGSFMGWSLIVPLSWAKAFWFQLISKGAHAIGLREKRWIACEAGLPFFPSDFPTCNAYVSLLGTERAAADQKAERMPPAMRPAKVPIPPPWNIVRVAVEKRCSAIQGAPLSGAEDIIGCNILSNARSRDSNITSLMDDSIPFNGIVARTSGELTAFLNEIKGDHLLLFPRVPDKKISFELMKNESKLSHQNGISQICYERKLCFVRVLLHAYKEGVFEEGAVVCAPSPIDASQWTSRSESDGGGFQFSQTSVGSYLKEQQNGKWELQLPEDPVARESYRWPIGFVTTGFVRGSKKPVAEAYCEAVLLAQLREEQWNETAVKRRKEIYVLVRNLRSSAYRRALASIVLEQQEDVEFL